MRGNDPDAALYWCASMIAAGEDPTFVARRIVIAASEDVGNADPRALQMAVAAMQAVEMIGLPEAQYALAQAAAYVASAPKSNRAGAASRLSWRLLAAHERQLDLGAAVLPIERERDQREAALGDLALETRDLVLVQQQLSLAQRVRVVAARLRVVRDLGNRSATPRRARTIANAAGQVGPCLGRSDFTSGPRSASPASNVSSTSYSKRARRLVAIGRNSAPAGFSVLALAIGARTVEKSQKRHH